jgi:hypothetical protein
MNILRKPGRGTPEDFSDVVHTRNLEYILNEAQEVDIEDIVTQCRALQAEYMTEGEILGLNWHFQVDRSQLPPARQFALRMLETQQKPGLWSVESFRAALQAVYAVLNNRLTKARRSRYNY